MDTQLLGYFLLVKLHRLDGDAENLGDFFANASFRHQLEHLALPGGEVAGKLSRPAQECWHFRAEALLDQRAALLDSAMSAMLDDLAAKNLTFGSCSQGFTMSQTDEAWAATMKDLTATAKALQRARMTRFVTWITSSDNNLTYLQNFRLHARRIGEAAAILGDAGVMFGLEYLGPKTMWARARYPFIHNMATMKELIAETGKPNVGFLLDIWHWYNAGDTVADVRSLKNRDVVAVHMSDAPAGVPIDQQVDSRRELPLATGVIDTAGFMNALNQIGYDGPAAAEPMNADLRKLPPEEALAKTADAMKKAFALIH